MDWQQVQDYLMQLSRHDDAVLTEMEESARQTRFPIIDRAAGKCCYLLCRLAKVRTVFEMGSGYGYSTAWFAMAVRDNGGGVVHHVVWDEELSRKAQDYLGRMRLTEFVRFTVGEAVETLRRTQGRFGCIFVDIEKQDYPQAVEVAKTKLAEGGLLILDNMLLHGRIFDANDHSPPTEGIRKATAAIFNDPDFVATLLPIRDGLVVAMKVR
ncbi:Putative O-methyltransferase [bacterium HR17]|jgi:predicted O-methyltransferase YrrM|uniref:O-methyltransferase n=1 Tax=Candidatus Fervidibacter japonicus TaxID=2035412 RepID=A0A2H5XAI8_9BACT|nr:Putative O-methyltransferase [bacterium HR17]